MVLAATSFRRSLLLFSLLLLSTAVLRSQPNDTKGKEFWVTFMQSEGTGSPDLRFYLSCDRPTSATITYTATGLSERVSLPTPNVPLEVNISNDFGTSVELDATPITRKSFHIVADDDITLYGCTIRVYSADAYLALPYDVLTKRYIVLAYTNGFDGLSYDRHSEFAVVATEDNTRVKITSRGNAVVDGNPPAIPFTVTLNRGEVFSGQASLIDAEDVSGTEVVASKPVAVFGGVERTAVPTSVGNNRDYLVEQIPPMEAWGKEAILTPHYPITPASPYQAVARILGMFDGTTWKLDGVVQGVLQRGVPVEIPLTKAQLVQADGPILVAQYEHSVGNLGLPPPFPLGDPFMMIIPPSEQFDTAYAFQSIIHPEFDAHYMNVVIPPNAVSSLRLDGQPVSQAFTPIAGTRFSYAQIELAAGSHFIRADSAFGLYVYGFGPANSYGYVGGMLFRTLVYDLDPPQVDVFDTCGTLQGIAHDDNFITDTGIDSCYATSDVSNVNLTIFPFPRHADTVRYTATLIDPYQDGVVGIRAVDSVGHWRTQISLIPGYTLRAAGMTDNSPLQLDSVLAFNQLVRCRTVRIENYGKFPHRVDSLWLDPDLQTKVAINGPQMPISIEPGESKDIGICVTGGGPDTSVGLALHIREDCRDRTIAAIPAYSGIDTTPPLLLDIVPSCSDDVTLRFTDIPTPGAGIDSVRIDTLVNCTATILTGGGNLPAGAMPVHNLNVELRRIDPRQDMIYRITVIDAVGNVYTTGDTIGGFTVAVIDKRSDTVAMRLNRDWNGDTLLATTERCDSLLIHNYGSQPLHLSNAHMQGNILYSIPPSQLPMDLQPGEVRKLAVCIQSVAVDQELDTLWVSDSCAHTEGVLMKTPIGTLHGSGHDICNNAITIDLVAPAKRTFITTPVPNPAHSSSASVDLGLAQNEIVTLELLDAEGKRALQVMQGIELPAGVSRIRFDISSLRSGLYFCRMTTASGGLHIEKMVVDK